MTGAKSDLQSKRKIVPSWSNGKDPLSGGVGLKNELPLIKNMLVSVRLISSQDTTYYLRDRQSSL